MSTDVVLAITRPNTAHELTQDRHQHQPDARYAEQLSRRLARSEQPASQEKRETQSQQQVSSKGRDSTASNSHFNEPRPVEGGKSTVDESDSDTPPREPKSERSQVSETALEEVTVAVETVDEIATDLSTEFESHGESDEFQDQKFDTREEFVSIPSPPWKINEFPVHGAQPDSSQVNQRNVQFEAIVAPASFLAEMAVEVSPSVSGNSFDAAPPIDVKPVLKEDAQSPVPVILSLDIEQAASKDIISAIEIAADFNSEQQQGVVTETSDSAESVPIAFPMQDATPAKLADGDRPPSERPSTESDTLPPVDVDEEARLDEASVAAGRDLDVGEVPAVHAEETVAPSTGTEDVDERASEPLLKSEDLRLKVRDAISRRPDAEESVGSLASTTAEPEVAERVVARTDQEPSQRNLQSFTATSATLVSNETTSADLDANQSLPASSADIAVDAVDAEVTRTAGYSSEPEAVRTRAPQPSASVDSSRSDVSMANKGVGSSDANPDIRDYAASALRAAAAFDRPIRIRLSPPELGVLQVEVSRQENGVTARFEVTSNAAHSTLNEHLSSLRETLSRLGVAVDRIEVRLAEPKSEDGHSREHRQSDQQQQQQQQQQSRQRHQGHHVFQDMEHESERSTAQSRTATVVDTVQESNQRQTHDARLAADIIDIQV